MKISPVSKVVKKTEPTILALFLIFLRLGLTSFGGPVAHLVYFRHAFVQEKKWLDEKSYADLIALCQFLPGPASSQVGMAVGLLQRGYLGAFVAWCGFTLPSALLLTGFAYGLSASGAESGAWISGLKVAAVAVVLKALLEMMATLTPDKSRATLAVAAASMVLALPSVWGQLSAIAFGALVGLIFLRQEPEANNDRKFPLTVGKKAGAISLSLFFVLLVGLPILAVHLSHFHLDLFTSFYRAGSLIFGGGHVVLPLLQSEVVTPGWISDDQFLSGYGAAQAIPGPLLTFSAYLGALIGGWPMALICLVAIFLPSFLLIIGTIPFWDSLRRLTGAAAALKGVNAAVVGLLLAAFYNPVWTAGIKSGEDFVLGMAAFLALYLWKMPPWLVVLLAALLSSGVAFLQAGHFAA